MNRHTGKMKKMAKATIQSLDAGQLDFMWNFLKFKGSGLDIADVKGIKENLDCIRQMMIQKTAGQEQYKQSYHIDINDLGTYINTVIIQAMSIHLAGGFDKLEAMCDVKGDD